MASLKELAAEREERNRSKGIFPACSSNVREVNSSSNPIANSATTSSRTSVSQLRSSSLKSAHRSIRIAHSIGLTICVFMVFLIFFPWIFRTQILICTIFVGGAWLARSGAGFVHRCLPSMLQEGAEPSSEEINAHDKCLFEPSLTGK
jgi:hypothetical protein